MKVLDVITTANHNLWRSKLRTLLTVLAIIVGAFTLTLTNSLGAGVQSYLDRQLGSVAAPGIFFVAPKMDSNPFAVSNEPKEYDPAKTQGGDVRFQMPSITNSDVDNLKQVAGVESVRPFRLVTTEYITKGAEHKKYVLSSVNPDTSLKLDLAAGRLIDNASDQKAAVLPENYLKVLGFSTPEDALDTELSIGYRTGAGMVEEQQVKIVGILKNSLVTLGNFYIDDRTLESMAATQGGLETNRFIAAIVKFSDTDYAKESQQRDALQKAGSYTATSLKERVATVSSVVSAITIGLSVVGFIALLAASFGIINTLLMSVYERTQEIGLMKALGMSRRAVFALFAIEAVLVGFWGSLIAVLIGLGAGQLINNFASSTFLKDFNGFQLTVVTPAGMLSVIGLIMLIAFLAGTLPAIKASRLNPIEALRSE